MFFNLIIIIISSLAIALFNNTFMLDYLGVSGPYVLLLILAGIVFVVLIDALIAILIHCLPRKWFNPYKKVFNVFKWERKFYNFIKIQKWKDKIPNKLGFNKEHIAEKDNNQYLFTFLEETCYAEVMHWLSAPLGFLVCILNTNYILTIWLPIAIVNLVLQIMPVFVQRFNRPRLKLLYERNEKNKN